MTTKTLNKVDKKTGHYLCCKCKSDAGSPAVIMRHKVYCIKCYEEKKNGNN